MPETSPKSPHPIDTHVGSRIRMRRALLGMTQQRLADAQDLTFAANFIQSRNFRAFETYLVVTAAYFVLALALRQLLAWIGQRFVVSRRTPRAARPAASAAPATTAGDAA